MVKNTRKTVISGAVTLTFHILVLMIVFRGHGREIFQSLRTVPAYGLLLLLVMALCCPLMEAAAGWLALRTQLPQITFWQSLEVSFLNIFGNVATLGAGSVPMQSWYLYSLGLVPGAGAGLVTICYTIQKATVLLYSTAMLLLQGRWLRKSNLSLSRYILIGYLVCALIISALLLLCTWGKVQELALWGIGKLPDTGKWPARKNAWGENIESLRTYSKSLLSDKKCCRRMVGIYAAKLCLLYAIPYRCMTLLGLNEISFWHVQLLSAVMVLISNAIPNVGGVGPAEFAFSLLYSPYIGTVNASTAMVLYRTASYFVPFLASIPFAVHLRTLTRKGTGDGKEMGGGAQT